MNDAPTSEHRAPTDLERLALAHDVALEYVDWQGVTRRAAPETLVAVLEALGVDASRPARALAEWEAARWARFVDPVAVAWDGAGALLVRTPAEASGARLEVEVATEDGRTLARALALDAPIEERSVIEAGGAGYVARRVRLPGLLPPGYHRARVALHHRDAALEGEALVVAAPRRAYAPPGDPHAFGVFAPLYALHSRHSAGVGDLADLRRLLAWLREHGGATVATLPLLATYFDDPDGVSPYSPVSRLAWNELFLHLPALPEYAASEEARGALEGPAALGERARLLAAPLVDYAAASRLKAPAIEAMARTLFEHGGPRLETLERFVRDRPELEAYARFRGAVVRLGREWRTWPARQRGGTLDERDVDPVACRAHLYAQFALDEQLSALAREAREGDGLGLYLDLPVGVHAQGFDGWRHPEAFAARLAAGAPPDAIFGGGQNWSFAPLHPRGLRASGYRYFIEVLRAQLRYAGMLRFDHVMAMHRIYAIPRGAPATEGAYLRYCPDELWAIVCLESHRARAVVTGEDLGTVPPAVRAAMREHGVGRSYVVQYEAQPRPEHALPPVPPLAVATLNTHDMPPFASWTHARDVELGAGLGWFAPDEAGRRSRARGALVEGLRTFLGLEPASEVGAASRDLLRALLHQLGASDARLVLVSLDDLWGGLEAQNVPGTTSEHPNWRRRLACSLEQLGALPEVGGLLDVLRAARAASSGGAGGRDLAPPAT